MDWNLERKGQGSIEAAAQSHRMRRSAVAMRRRLRLVGAIAGLAVLVNLPSFAADDAPARARVRVAHIADYISEKVSSASQSSCREVVPSQSGALGDQVDWNGPIGARADGAPNRRIAALRAVNLFPTDCTMPACRSEGR